jgi:hypothetical protein
MMAKLDVSSGHDYCAARRAVLAIAIALTSLKLLAYNPRYLPLNETELALRFPQHVLRSTFVQDMSAQVGTTAVRFLGPGNEIQFTGKDLAGKPWKVTAEAMRGGALYSADLDHNGMVDLIYASYTGGNGLAPPMHVLTLLFDSAGRPVPSEIDGYFEIDSRGVKDLVDLDGDGRAELIRQSFDDGYWITSLYEASTAHWNLIHGRHAARNYPMYTRFTNRSNRVPTNPAPGRNPIEDDLSNAVQPGAAEVRIEHLKWSDVQQSENPVLQLSDGRRCEEMAWYSSAVVVVDSPSQRSGATLGAPEQAKELLESIVRRRLPVRIAGNRRNRDSTSEQARCSPEMVWASDTGTSNHRIP